MRISKSFQDLILFISRRDGFKWSAYEKRVETSPLRYETLTTVRVVAESIEGTGGSLHPSREHAFLLAAIEAFERWCFARFLLPNSNGCALHFHKSAATLNARLELIERDAFFCHFLTRQPPTFAKNRDGIQIFDLRSSTRGVSCAMAMKISEDKKRLAIGLGSATSKPGAYQHALREAISAWARCDRYENSGMAWNPEHHAQMGNDPLLIGRFLRVFNDRLVNAGRSQEAPLERRLRLNEIPVTEFDLSRTFLKSSKLRFVQATSAHLQEPFWGLPKPLLLNEKRLREFSAAYDKRRVPWKTFHLFG